MGRLLLQNGSMEDYFWHTRDPLRYILPGPVIKINKKLNQIQGGNANGLEPS